MKFKLRCDYEFKYNFKSFHATIIVTYFVVGRLVNKFYTYLQRDLKL